MNSKTTPSRISLAALSLVAVGTTLPDDAVAQKNYTGNLRWTHIQDSATLEKRLAEIAKTPYQGEKLMGAMCYTFAPKEDTVQYFYTCPICKQKTPDCKYRLRNLADIKKMVAEIRQLGYDAKLDEHELCNNCNPDKRASRHLLVEEGSKKRQALYSYLLEHPEDVAANRNYQQQLHALFQKYGELEENAKDPMPIFKIRFTPNAAYHAARSFDYFDYKYVLEFLKGNDAFVTKSETTMTLHNNVDVLQRMLGLGADIKVKKKR